VRRGNCYEEGRKVEALERRREGGGLIAVRGGDHRHRREG